MRYLSLLDSTYFTPIDGPKPREVCLERAEQVRLSVYFRLFETFGFAMLRTSLTETFGQERSLEFGGRALRNGSLGKGLAD